MQTACLEHTKLGRYDRRGSHWPCRVLVCSCSPLPSATPPTAVCVRTAKPSRTQRAHLPEVGVARGGLHPPLKAALRRLELPPPPLQQPPLQPGAVVPRVRLGGGSVQLGRALQCGRAGRAAARWAPIRWRLAPAAGPRRCRLHQHCLRSMAVFTAWLHIARTAWLGTAPHVQVARPLLKRGPLPPEARTALGPLGAFLERGPGGVLLQVGARRAGREGRR